MYSEKLKQELRERAINYSKANCFVIDEYKSAVLFSSVRENFHPKTFDNISKTKNTNWIKRLEKIHPKVPTAFEMQSSNSSDALLMNIFCHPGIKGWKGISDLFEGNDFSNKIEFGCKAGLLKEFNIPDETEIDLVCDSFFAEAKLTETGFSTKNTKTVECYNNFDKIFDKSKLNQSNSDYCNYQLIRNIIFANRVHKNFFLLCDMRRPDLAQQFYGTVICIKDINLRKLCKIVYWQDIANCIGKDLKDFLEVKYGI